MRIVSLLPSATEMIAELGLVDQLCGVTHECDFPPCVVGLPIITKAVIPSHASSAEIDELVRIGLNQSNALFSLDVERLRETRPDYIVTQSLCDVCAVSQDEVLAAANGLDPVPEIINLAPMSLQDMLDGLLQLGDAFQCSGRAEQSVESLVRRIETVQKRSQSLSYRPSVALLEWIAPPFSAGHWNPELVRLAGGVEWMGREGEKSCRIEWRQIVDADPEIIVIACCGFSVERAQADIQILQSYPGYRELRCVRDHQVYLVDGSSYFNRPGPRLVDSLEILAHAIHSATHPLPFGLPSPIRIA
jgi:iron complex transport system substrate-binding protein